MLALPPATDGAPPRRIGIIFGAAGEGGFFARTMDEPGVFLAPPALRDVASRPAVDRGRFRIDPATLTRLALTRSGARIVLSRAPEGDRLERLDRDDAGPDERLESALAALSADGAVHTGPPAREEGIDHPTLEIDAIRRGDGGPPLETRITVGAIGAPERAGKGEAYFARVAGVDATFVVPKACVDAILDALVIRGRHGAPSCWRTASWTSATGGAPWARSASWKRWSEKRAPSLLRGFLPQRQDLELAQGVREVPRVKGATNGLFVGCRRVLMAVRQESLLGLLDGHPSHVNADGRREPAVSQQRAVEHREPIGRVLLPEALVDHHLLGVVRPPLDERIAAEGLLHTRRRVLRSAALHEVPRVHLVNRRGEQVSERAEVSGALRLRPGAIRDRQLIKRAPGGVEGAAHLDGSRVPALVGGRLSHGGRVARCQRDDRVERRRTRGRSPSCALRS